jgi:hypothetical protein
METPKEYYYTYYSYEEWGRGYFGSRGCKCLPEEDVKYLGSSKDKNFKPTQKIILKDDYATREEAYADEIILQQYYKVVENPHFANKAYQTSTKFCVSGEQAKKYGRIAYELGIGAHALTFEQKSENGRKGGKIGGKVSCPVSGKNNYEKKIGIHAQTPEEKAELARKGHKTQKELGIGFWGLTLEQRQENARKGEQKRKERNVGLYSLTKEERSEAGKKSAQKLHSERWMCLETGHTTNAGALTKFQKNRGIDTSKRKRIS